MCKFFSRLANVKQVFDDSTFALLCCASVPCHVQPNHLQPVRMGSRWQNSLDLSLDFVLIMEQKANWLRQLS